MAARLEPCQWWRVRQRRGNFRCARGVFGRTGPAAVYCIGFVSHERVLSNNLTPSMMCLPKMGATLKLALVAAAWR